MIMMIGIPILSFATADQLMNYFAEKVLLLSEQFLAPPDVVSHIGCGE